MGAEGSSRSLRVRVAGQRGQLTVGDRLTARNAPKRLGYSALELGAPVELERDARELHGDAAEVRLEALGETLRSPAEFRRRLGAVLT